MNSSTMRRIHVRPIHRTWLTIKGGVAMPIHDNADHTAEPIQHRLEWEASVIDTTTDEPVAGYPKLSGVIATDNPNQAEAEVGRTYQERLRFVDGQKPDLDLLNKNLDIAVWDISVKLHGAEVAEVTA